jgi:hypothetical protein
MSGALIAAAQDRQLVKLATRETDKSVTGEPLQRVLGHKAIATGIAGPEIAHDIVGNES